MGTLSHVLEANGLATVGISLVRHFTERIRPPRALYCAFPYGRPLGRPGDPAFQHAVLAAAFDLLGLPRGPVLADFPVAVEEEPDEMAACVLPPADDGDEAPAIAEARGLLPAYRRTLERSGRTNVGRFVADGEAVADAIGWFVKLGGGVGDPESLDVDSLRDAASDIRAYYEEAALSLLDHVPAARQVDNWIYAHTAVGAALRAAWLALQESGVAAARWKDIIPGVYHPNTDAW